MNIVKCTVLIVFILKVALCRKILLWSARREKEGQFYKQRGILRAPRHYNFSKSRISISVRRYYRIFRAERNQSNTCYHYFMISGGPGQSHSVWNADINSMLMIAPTDSIIYTMDMRGLGESTLPFPKSSQEGWQERCSKAKGDLTYISINNIATDYALLRREICDEFYSTDARFILFGVSFGGLVAARIVHLFPHLFDWLIMDSPSTIKGRFNPSNDQSFWEIYRKSEDAYSVNWLKEAFDKLNRGTCKNKCTEALKNAGWPTLWELFRPLLKGDVEMRDLGSNSHSATLVPSLIKEIYDCDNINKFYFQTIPYLQGIVKQSNVEITEKKKDSHSLDLFFNAYICINELFPYPLMPRVCAKGKHKFTLTDQCTNWRTYQNDYKLLKKRLYRRPPVRSLSNVIDTDRTMVVVLSGGLDLVTPSPPIKKWLQADVDAPLKLWLQLDAFGHAIFPVAPCMTLLLDLTSSNDEEMITKVNRVRKCVRMVNKKLKPIWHDI